MSKPVATCQKAESVRKVSDKEFLQLLRENGGLYARTARAIAEKFKVSYSRQAVRERAEKFPLELADIEDEVLDKAEESLHNLMDSADEKIKFRAVEMFLKTRGRRRGYNDKIILETPKPSDEQLARELMRRLIENRGFTEKQALAAAVREFPKALLTE